MQYGKKNNLISDSAIKNISHFGCTNILSPILQKAKVLITIDHALYIKNVKSLFVYTVMIFQDISMFDGYQPYILGSFWVWWKMCIFLHLTNIGMRKIVIISFPSFDINSVIVIVILRVFHGKMAKCLTFCLDNRQKDFYYRKTIFILERTWLLWKYQIKGREWPQEIHRRVLNK